MVGAPYAHFKHWEPLIVQIDAQGSLVGSMVAEHEHGRPHKVERQ